MLSKKWVTWALILLILLLPTPAVVKYLQAFIVRNAVVTAFAYQVRAPIDGVVETLDVRPGDVPGSAPVLVVRNHRLPLADIGGLKSRCVEKQKYYAALEDELVSLETRLRESRNRLAGYRTVLQKDLAQTLAILKAREAGEKARLEEAAQTLERTLSLTRTSAATQEAADRAEARFQEARARLSVTRLEQARITHRRQMLRQHLFPPDISDGPLQEQGRINDLENAILDCRRRMQVVETDLAADAGRVQALRQDLETKSTRAEVTLPDTAVIWDVNGRAGMEVAKGDQILSYIDRSRLMVDVAVDDATLHLIRPDHPVRIRLFGSGRFIDGRVMQVMGSAARMPAHRFAASVKDKSPRDGHVLVRIDDPELYRSVEKFCGIGRTTYAEFEGIGLLEQYFGTFLR